MSIVGAVVGRNLRIFFRDGLNVILSLLSGLILFLLYTLFLARLQTDALTAQFPDATEQQVSAFVDSWMFSGIVLLTTITTGLGALSGLVEDGQSRRFSDFLVTPIRRSHLVLGYLIAAVTVAVIMSIVVLLLSLGYLGFVDGVWLAPAAVTRIVGVMLLCCVAFTAVSALLASFIRSSAAFSALATVVGAALGFIAGAYIPVGSIPAGVASSINALPFAQAAMLLRRPFTEDAIDALSDGSGDAATALRETYGVDIFIGDVMVPAWVALAVLAVMAVGFTALAAGRIRSVIR